MKFSLGDRVFVKFVDQYADYMTGSHENQTGFIVKLSGNQPYPIGVEFIDKYIGYYNESELEFQDIIDNEKKFKELLGVKDE